MHQKRVIKIKTTVQIHSSILMKNKLLQFFELPALVPKFLVTITLLLYCSTNINAANVPLNTNIDQQKLTGTVLDNTGMPLPGASIMEVNTTNGASSDFDGNFELNVSQLPAVIKISYIGFTTQEITIESLAPLQVQLQADRKSVV